MTNQISVVSLLPDYYSKRYEAWDATGDLHDVILKHGNKKFSIYRTIIKEVGKTLKNNSNSFYCEINETVNELLFDDLYVQL